MNNGHIYFFTTQCQRGEANVIKCGKGHQMWYFSDFVFCKNCISAQVLPFCQYHLHEQIPLQKLGLKR